MLDGVEVARVQLDHNFPGSKHIDAPTLGVSALEIQFLEVAKSYRRRGLGAEVVQRLVADYPNRRFLALSEDADEFWAALGWNRYDYYDGSHQYQPLFVAPA
jgi:ribosomal protein S18 acetylase RimI-like enzyme